MNTWLESIIEKCHALALLPLELHVFLTNIAHEGLFYLPAALLFWGLLHGLLKKRLAHRLIDEWLRRADIRREIAYSMLSLTVFAAMSLVVAAGVFEGHVTIYRRADQYGWTWLIASLPLMILWHDFYFYWMHRLLHTRWMFRHVHSVHHRSRQPSPWAAYAFHPIEALINGLVTPLILFTVPVHVSVLVAFSIHQIMRNAHGHAAVETMPAGFARHPIGRLFTTTTHHHLHHETGRGNYGLWFTWWDQWCGTERRDYLVRFDEATCHDPIENSVPMGPQSRHAPAHH